MKESQEKYAGIITLWKGNIGSQLQCYATKKIFEKKGIKCILIERQYTSKFEFFICGFKNVIYRKWLYISNIKEIGKIKEFLKACRRLSNNNDFSNRSKFVLEELQPQYMSYTEMKRFARSNKCVFFLAGSDQVWNGSNIYRWIPGFLDFVPSEKRIAFAASFGGVVEKYNYRRYISKINSFRFISIREKYGYEFIRQNCSKKECYLIADPVVQLDRSEWSSFVKKVDEMDYIFIYFLDRPTEETCEYLKKQKNLIITPLNLEYFDGIKKLYKCDIAPDKVLSYIANAKMILTDSFHITAFSVIFHKNFFSFERQYTHGFNQSERIVSFLQQLDLLERYVKSSKQFDGVQSIDFELVECKLDNMRKISQKFVDKIVNGEKAQ